jgi:protoporphyrinogen oxidase
MPPERAIIIGAGPAGLTAALELLRRTNIRPIVLEATQAIGGISQTVRYKGNRMDIGGHRFFSKSDRVMQWWLELMPLQAAAIIAAGTPPAPAAQLRYQGQSRPVPTAATLLDETPDPSHDPDLVMLLRSRKSRIYFLRKFFDYPIRLTARTLLNLGLFRTLRAGLSYAIASVFPRKEERTLEDFLVNRFGRQLYRLFFESYTEKVWGVPCNQISAEWGAQRIKGMSLTGVLRHFIRTHVVSRLQTNTIPADPTHLIAQKETETSLIEQFLYPKFGPGQLWEHVADLIQQLGGELHRGVSVDGLTQSGNTITAVEAHTPTGEVLHFEADYVFSTMPVQDLIRALSIPPPEPVRSVSEGLIYRDFITVGLLASKLAVHEKDGTPLKDNWIYIQEPDVQVGRLQIFNNWSPSMVADPSKIWIGLEYFCYQTDALWQMSDPAIIALATEEISRIGILHAADVLDAHVVRMPKTYPAYFGTYDRFDLIRKHTDTIENLFLIGRNGMHKYNNQDHSMLTAMTAVDNIANGITDKSNLWSINTEMDYHEEK